MLKIKLRKLFTINIIPKQIESQNIQNSVLNDYFLIKKEESIAVLLSPKEHNILKMQSFFVKNSSSFLCLSFPPIGKGKNLHLAIVLNFSYFKNKLTFGKVYFDNNIEYVLDRLFTEKTDLNRLICQEFLKILNSHITLKFINQQQIESFAYKIQFFISCFVEKSFSRNTGFYKNL